MKTKILPFILLFSIVTFSQFKDTNGQWVFGGNLGIGGGSNGGFGINISPEVGFRFNNGFEIGAKVGYNYNKNDFFKSNFGNVGPYINYTILQSVFLRAQYEYLFGTVSNETIGGQTFDDKISENALWLGGGYQNNISQNIRYNIGLMYNVLYDEETSVYPTGLYPIAGVSFGF